MASTLTPTAVTGFGVGFVGSEAKFLEADVGRQIIYRASRAFITGFGGEPADTQSPGFNVRADIIDDFPNTNPIPADQWFLRLSPQTTLDPDKKGPIGARVTLVAGLPAWRLGDIGKYIKIYSGVIRILSITSVTTVIGEIMGLLDVTVDDPPPAPAGSWTLEVSSWSDANGYPRTGEFYQGRLLQASTTEQPTTWWLSASDDYDNYAAGSKADDAIEYTIASRQVNRIEWAADMGVLLMGTSGAEFRIQGMNQGDPLGGDVVPDVKRFTPEGSSPFQPVTIGKRLLFFDRSQKKIFSIAFNMEEDGYDTDELTALAEHITGLGGIRLRGVAVVKRPDPRVYMVRRDGQLVVLTFYPKEKVVGFTRITTDGVFESVAAVPQGPGSPDRVWVTVAREVNGVTQRYMEFFQDDITLDDRDWTALQTDSAVVYTGPAITTISNLAHLEGKTVNVVSDGSFRGTRVVSGGVVTLEEPASVVEIGLDYASIGVTKRPAVEGSVIEGLPRSWDTLWARFLRTVGGTINGQPLIYAPGPPGRPNYFGGDVKVTGEGWDIDGRVLIEQRQPYPMTVLALFGTLSVGDHD